MSNRTTTGLETLRLLASQGAKFCKVAAWNASVPSPGKQPMGQGWQNKPYTFDQVKAHLESGNAGLLTGKHSGGLCILDVDENYSGFIEKFPELATCQTITRAGANKGKLIIRIIGDLPDSRSFFHPGEKAPFFEFLSNGRQGVCAGIHPEKVDYQLINADSPIPEYTKEQLADLVYSWTGQRLEAEEASLPTTYPKRRAATPQEGGDHLKERVLEAWPTLKIFEHWGRASEPRKDGNQIRLQGNGGLLVREDGAWYCHAAQMGGWELEAWQFCKQGDVSVPKNGQFPELLKEMAQAGGIPLPERKQKQPPADASQAEQPEGPEANYLLTTLGDHEGHAICVLHLYPQNFAYCDAYGWLFYNGRFWQRENAESFIDRAIVATLRKRRSIAAAAEDYDLVKASKATSGNVTGTKELLRSKVVVSVEQFDNNPDLLNCKNGVVDLRTGGLASHSAEQLFTYCLNVDYNPQADRRPWLDFLQSVTNDELQAFLQLSVGYSLTGLTWEEVMFYLHGPTRSGKGTFTETLIALMSKPLATEAEFQTFTSARNGDTQNFDLAPLKPCRFVAASESNKNQPLNPAKIKQLTGRNWVTCAFKHRDHFGYQPQFKIWLSSNHPVNVDVDDDAAWARVRVIEFPHSHLGKEDKKLKERLTKPAALEGVLAWAVEGSRKWYQLREEGQGLPNPETVKAATEAQRDQQDFIKAFMNECLVKGAPEDYLINSEAYGHYKTWCDQNGVTPKQLKQFSEAMGRKGYQTKTKKLGGRVVRVFDGLKLQADLVPAASYADSYMTKNR